MVHFVMQVADRVVAVSALFKSTRRFCGSYLCEAVPDFSVVISQQDLEFERIIFLQENATKGVETKIADDSLLECTALQRKIAERLLEYDTLLFHGSVISVDSEGYLFTARSGTGKSTHTRLWREMLGDRALMINDDKPFLNVRDNDIQVCGSPWKGKHGLGNNTSVPLKAICILERGEQNIISSISAKEAVPTLLQQSNRPQQTALLPKYLDILENIANKVAFYRLKCNMDPEAAMISYQTMSGGVKEN